MCHVEGESILDPKAKATPHPFHQFLDRYLLRAALILTLVTGFFPVPATQAYDEPVELPSTPFVIETLAFAPEVKPNIEKVDTSPYLIAEAQRAEKTRKASQQRNLTAKSTQSGTDYGQGYVVLDSGKPQYRNCVATVRMFRPYPQGGNPYRTPIFVNTKTPTVGAVAVQRTHVSLVIGVGDGFVTVKEGNFRSGYLTQRNIPTSQIIGYWF